MIAPDARDVESMIATNHYPITDPSSDAWQSIVSRVRYDIERRGCGILAGFIRPSLHEALRSEGERAAPNAYYDAETVNVYNTDVDMALPDGHPGRVTMRRGNAFVARDQIDRSTMIHRLYTNGLFQRFIADCFGLTRLHELADPLSGLVLNVIKPGLEHPWHFDTNEFTVSLLTQQPQSGGIFEYCPSIRSAQDENLDDVAGVLAGREDRLIRRLELRPGDLQLFKGRYALHRVSTVLGEVARHTAIFAYSELPGVIGSVARTRQLFGRVLPEHEAAQRRVRVDQLLD